jgi:hypothetical protein
MYKKNYFGAFLLVTSLTGCVAPQAYFPQMPVQQGSLNTPSSNHAKFSQVKAEEFIVMGKTNAAEIVMNYGEPNLTMKNPEGEDVWMYQAKSVLVGVDVDSASNINVGLGSSSSAMSTRGATEVSSKSTVLKITFDPIGIVKNFESHTTMN